MTPASIPQAQVDAAMAMLAHYGVPEDKARIALFAAWAATTTPDKDFAAVVEEYGRASSAVGRADVHGVCGKDLVDVLNAAVATRQALLARYEAAQSALALAGKTLMTLDATNARLSDENTRLQDEHEAMRVENERLRACLQPFAEAARNASISGQPPFQFCAAGDYERAEAMLNQSKAPRSTLHATETEGRS